jgi:hypothetical protein
VNQHKFHSIPFENVIWESERAVDPPPARATNTRNR